MNKDIFKAIMRPALESNTTRDGNQFGELLATAYSYSTLGFAKTLYGAKLIQGQKAFLQDAISNAVNSNQGVTSRDILQTTSKLMAVGFIGYWAAAKFDLAVPKPALSLATIGTKVMFPGAPEPLATHIWLAFSQGYTEKFLDVMCSALIMHQTTIQGTVMGTDATGKPVPVPIPWMGII